ncbi:hypothetical protein BKM31_20890 [[Actinomadura] parvosata subsp. kistnae]|uniref:Aspartyl/asparaginy/proline hydroxylase domain-containing protein n=1 Tax=[Actinomadura] parvosata subsp. kistnae TaxID=1909395 RepID=A0A1V0AK40_9ACTN|nr:hypothetical protein BKM31_20890 [Nonomuraea sp. ATCC 55076]
MDLSFDIARLLEDLDQVKATAWKEIRIVSGDGLGDYATKLDWRTVPLRSIGGDGDRGDAGGPDLADFADTPWLARLPHLAEVLKAIPARLASVRLMALGPGARTPLHSDTKVGLPWGSVRLHVPIVTMPEATLTIAGEVHCWPPGTVWYADFTRGHMVENTGTDVRVHLVIDSLVTPALLALFPPVFHGAAVHRSTIFEPEAAPLGRDALERLRCRFTLPESFRSWEEPEGAFLEDQPGVPASVDRHAGGLGLYVNGEPVYGLVHRGAGEFRFAGWTGERTVQVRHDEAGSTQVVLRTRAGDRTFSRTLDAQALSPVGGAR